MSDVKKNIYANNGKTGVVGPLANYGPKPDAVVRMLLISPLHDVPTIQSWKMVYQVADLVEEHPKIYVKRLGGVWANHYTLVRHLQRNRYDLVCYFGHGKKGGWVDPLFRGVFADDILDLLKGSVVYTMACLSATDYGRHAVEKGAIAYIGNTEEVWAGFNTSERNYADDFARPHQNEILNLLSGVSLRACVDDAVLHWRQLADLYESDPALVQGAYYAEKARFNADHHVCLGDCNFTLPKAISDRNELDMGALGSFWGGFL